MGMRPTIGICYDGKIVDAVLLKNYGLASLLMICFRMYQEYKDCTTAQAYRERDIAKMLEHNPDYPPLSDKQQQDYVDFILQCTEFPLIVDMTNHCVYYGVNPETLEVLKSYPDSRNMMNTLSNRQYSNFDINVFYNFMESCVFWLDELDVEEILKLAGEAAGTFYHKFYW